jgi:hypothetical protein
MGIGQEGSAAGDVRLVKDVVSDAEMEEWIGRVVGSFRSEEWEANVPARLECVAATRC